MSPELASAWLLALCHGTQLVTTSRPTKKSHRYYLCHKMAPQTHFQLGSPKTMLTDAYELLSCRLFWGFFLFRKVDFELWRVSMFSFWVLSHLLFQDFLQPLSHCIKTLHSYGSILHSESFISGQINLQLNRKISNLAQFACNMKGVLRRPAKLDFPSHFSVKQIKCLAALSFNGSVYMKHVMLGGIPPLRKCLCTNSLCSDVAQHFYQAWQHTGNITRSTSCSAFAEKKFGG